MQHILSKHLEEIRDNAQNETEKGKVFENIVKTYLENDKTQTQHYNKVWHYKEWAKDQGLAERDTGIDLVAQRSDGSGYCAIQCKFYKENNRLTQETFDSFVANASAPHFTNIIIADTTLPEYNDNLINLLNITGKPWKRINLAKLRESNIDWEDYLTNRTVKLKEPKKPYDYQEEAITKVIEGLKTKDRGRMIMACGTGKTFTSLCIAQDMDAVKTVLYMVPSLALMSQTVLEWKYNAKNDFQAFSICSDVQVGIQNDDSLQLPRHELAFSATTDAQTIATQVKNADPNQMVVVFCTYHSVEVLTDAQKLGLPEFDLIICDEAHRTAGLVGKDAKNKNEEKTDSMFRRIHEDKHVKGKKRLYMTATPKIYSKDAQEKVTDYNTDKDDKDSVFLASMENDNAFFGEEFYRLDFSEAVERELLSDYKVIVLAVDENFVSASMQERLAEGSELKTDDRTKIIGCYKALIKHGIKNNDFDDILPMKRALAFSNRVDTSDHIANEFPTLTKKYDDADTTQGKQLDITAKHIDGTTPATERQDGLRWLADNPGEDACRILSNVRCLSEGVDVPALDAIMFMQPRQSQIEVVQAVGRVMRVAPDKKMGYVILPIVVKARTDAATALDRNKGYEVIWQVLNALRTHDSRLDSVINRINLNDNTDVTGKIQVIGLGKDFSSDDEYIDDIPEDDRTQMFLPFDEMAQGIYAQIVLKCGTRGYWKHWAEEVGEIAQTHIKQITAIIERNDGAKTAFDAFLHEIRDDLNPEVTQENAIEMLAQHMITKPVFDMLFKDNEFTKHNPVSKAMETVLKQLDQHNLDNESKGLQRFYKSVQKNAEGMETAAERQKLILSLYDDFFGKAFPALTQKLGIVYTPVEVVDFIIHSVNDVLKSEFDTNLGAEGVHILDPFTGTGTFITRLLQSGCITPAQMEYKYKNEIHANELVLLAYYIAAINIESVYRDKAKEHANGAVLPYMPFGGIVLTDTFQLQEAVQKDMDEKWSPDNSERRKKQQSLDIQVIMGNPPYSVGQRSQNDDAKNVGYPILDKAIRDSYAKHSTATNQRNLYDSYVRAIRWASDRIAEKGNDRGIVAYVSNGGWVDSNSADGLRKSLAEEFSSLYIFHLRGNIRRNMATGGLAGEGDNIFGSGSMTGIAISILVRDPKAKEFGKIHFHDIGDNLKTEQKLARISQFKSIDGITAEDGWQDIQPDEDNDWINQGDPSFANHISIGTKKDKKATTIFTNYSSGIVTSRDAWVYNASKEKLGKQVSSLIDFYNSEVKRFVDDGTGKKPDSFVDADPTKISWSRSLKGTLAKKITTSFNSKKMVVAHYRPFQKQVFYFDRFLNEAISQIPKIFPHERMSNLVISINGLGSMKDFSVLLMDCIPDFESVSKNQVFPLKFYEAPETGDDMLKSETTNYTERNGISNEGLAHFKAAYPNESITKEDLFYYIYGLLHSPQYRDRFKNNLSKELPRIPAVKTFADFQAFSRAGRELGDLHVNYEKADLYPIAIKGEDDLLVKKTARPPEDYRVKKMKFGAGKDKTTVIYNTKITIKGIPLPAYEYIVNGRSALEWVMDRQCVKTDKASGIINDANDYANETMQNPAYPLQLFQRVITVSLKTMEIIDTLPDLDID